MTGNKQTSTLSENMAFLCSPEAEHLPDGERLTLLIGLSNTAIKKMKTLSEDSEKRKNKVTELRVQLTLLNTAHKTLLDRVERAVSQFRSVFK